MYCLVSIDLRYSVTAGQFFINLGQEFVAALRLDIFLPLLPRKES